MTNQTEEWKEFYSYVEFCVYAAGFKNYSHSKCDPIFALEPEEKILAVYRNTETLHSSTIWVSNRALFLAMNDEECSKIPFEKIANVRPGFEDILEALENPKHRTAILNLTDGNQIVVPMKGTTFGDLDLLKLAFLVSNAHQAIDSTEKCEDPEGKKINASKSSTDRKLELCQQIIKRSPDFLQEDVKRVVKVHSVKALSHRLELFRKFEEAQCIHAGLISFMIPELSNRFAGALHRVPERQHNLILLTLKDSENTEQYSLLDFLSKIESESMGTAITETIEIAALPAYSVDNEMGQNNDVMAPQISEFLEEVLDKSRLKRTRLLATKWLPFYKNSIESCLIKFKELIKSTDRDVRAISLIQLEKLSSDYKNIDKSLWKLLEDMTWESNEQIKALPDASIGKLPKFVRHLLVRRATNRIGKEELIKKSIEYGNYWFDHIRRTDAINKDKTENGIRKLYKAIGISEDPEVIWCTNPIKVIETIFDIKDNNVDSTEELNHTSEYMEKLVKLINLFPINDEEGSAWLFGLPGSWPRPEVELDHWCGTHMINRPPPRNRDVWDVIKDQAYSHFRGDDEMLWGQTDFGSPEIQKRLSRHKSVERYLSSLFDRKRLRAIGYRIFLKSIGACPYKEDGLEEIIENCGGFIAIGKFIVAIERPVAIHRDDRGRLHNDDGKSIEYSDGWGCYSLNGMTVKDTRIVTHPEEITADDIDKQTNAEIRRVMIELYGAERYLKDSGAEIIDENEKFGTLYRKEINSHDHILMIKLTNRTQEPDGTFKHYYLNVPPQIRTAREAVAWTFGMTEKEYDPEIES